MIFDTHAHYDDDAFDEDRDTLLGEIFSSGICCITDVGASVKSSKSAVALSKKSASDFLLIISQIHTLIYNFAILIE